MSTSFAGVGTALAALGVTLSAGMFVKFASDGIKAMAVLHDLADVSGITVESLSAMTEVAKLSGTDMQTVATSAGKLSKAMLEVASTGQGKAAQAFKDLGVSVTDASGKLRASDDVMQEVAKKLFDMENATQRVAYAQLLFGKSGAQLLPFLRELSEAGTLSAKVTTEQAAAADKFEDSLVKLGTAATKLKIAFANDLLPWLNNVTEAMIRGQKEGGALAAVIAGIGAAVAGTDRHRNNVALIEDTELLLKKEEELGILRAADMRRELTVASAATRASEVEVAKIKARITSHQAFRKVQDEGDAAEAAAAERRKKALKDVEIAGAKDKEKGKSQRMEKLMSFDELLSKNATKRLAIYDAAEQAADREAEAQTKLTATLLARWDQEAAQRMDIGEQNESVEAVNRQLDAMMKVHETVLMTTEATSDLGGVFVTAGDEAIRKWEGVGNLLKKIGVQIAQIAYRETVSKPLEAAVKSALGGFNFGSGTSGSAAFNLRGLFSSNNALGGDYGQFFAEGGHPRPNSWAMVGEKGPELAYFGSGGGTVVPSGGGGTVVNVNNSIDARGADSGAVARIQAGMDRMARDIVPQVVDAVRRGGSARRFMGA